MDLTLGNERFIDCASNGNSPCLSRAGPPRHDDSSYDPTALVVAAGTPAPHVGKMVRTSIDELLAEARRRLRRLDPAAALAAMGSGATLIDIRSDSQIAADGVVPGALVIARNVLEWRLDPASEYRHPRAPGLDDPVILMCNEGYQSSLAAATLQQLGFNHATDLEGGFQAWRAAGLPIERASKVEQPQPDPPL